MADLAEVIVTKPTVDARTDPTRPPTAVIDTATGYVTPVVPGSRVTVLTTEPEPWWMSLAMIGGAVLAFGAAIWVFRRLAGPLADADEAVIVRRRRPVVIYEDDPAPIYMSSRRSEPTVVIEEPPNVLVNPGKKVKGKGKKSKKRRNTWTADGWTPTPDSAEVIRDGVVVWRWQLLNDEELGARTEDYAREMLENAARVAGSAGLIEDGDVLRMTVHGRTTERTVRRPD